MSQKRVLNVGQCAMDTRNINDLLHRLFTVEVIPARSRQEALERLRHEAYDLVLVNRILDGTGESGLDLIREVKADSKTTEVTVMLVSNSFDAQQEAEAAGAAPGFGKARLDDPETAQKLYHYLG